MSYCRDCKHYMNPLVAEEPGGGTRDQLIPHSFALPRCAVAFLIDDVTGVKRYDTCAGQRNISVRHGCGADAKNFEPREK